MKSRRVFVLLELQTDELLETLAKQWTWEEMIRLGGGDGTKVLQVMANVSQEAYGDGESRKT